MSRTSSRTSSQNPVMDTLADLATRLRRGAARVARDVSERLDPAASSAEAVSTIIASGSSSSLQEELVSALVRAGVAVTVVAAAAAVVVPLAALISAALPERPLAPLNGRVVAPSLVVLQRLHRRGLRMSDLSQHERTLLPSVVLPGDVETEMDDIGGLADAKRALLERAVDPLAHPELFAGSELSRRPGGVLLHGPPGTGKTLLAKALAHASDAVFIAASPATLQSVWFGDSPKLADALFSLARKMSPSIIFLDEIDGLLGRRGGSASPLGGGGEHESTAALTTMLLQCWDGITSSSGGSGDDWVLVIGATNRPGAIDEAALRRMPCRLLVPPPDAAGRVEILRAHLRREQPAGAAAAEDDDVDLAVVAASMVSFTGADIAEVVREASFDVRRAAVAQAKASASAPHDARGPTQGAGPGTRTPLQVQPAATQPAALVRRIRTAELLAATERVRRARGWGM